MEITIPYYEDNTRISNSSLGWFMNSPRYFKDVLDGKIELPETPAMKNGTMVHTYILQKEDFFKNYKILDFETPSSAQQKQFCQDYIDSNASTVELKAIEAFSKNYSTKGKKEEDLSTKATEMAIKLKPYIKWLKNQKNKIITISWPKMNSLKTVEENLKRHKKANELIYEIDTRPEVETHNEFHINWEVPVENNEPIKCKSLIDRLIINHQDKKIILCDIKTTESLKNFRKSFNEYDYGRQMAFYWSAIYWYFTFELKIDIEEYSYSTYIIAIQNSTDECRVFRIDESIIEEKTEQIGKILSQIHWHQVNNLWDYNKEYYEGDGSEPLPNDS